MADILDYFFTRKADGTGRKIFGYKKKERSGKEKNIRKKREINYLQK